MRSLISKYGAVALSLVTIIIVFGLFYSGIAGQSVQTFLGKVMYDSDSNTRLTDSNSVKEPIVDISNKNNNGGVNLEVRSSGLGGPMKIYADEVYSINTGEGGPTLFVNKGTDILTSKVYALRIRDQNNKPLNYIYNSDDPNPELDIRNGDLRGKNEITFPSPGIYYIDVKAIDKSGVETVGTIAVTVNSWDEFNAPD